MKRILTIALLGTTFAGLPILAGCDDKEKSKSDVEVKHADGSSTVDKQTTSTDTKTGDTTIKEVHKSTGAATTQP